MESYQTVSFSEVSPEADLHRADRRGVIRPSDDGALARFYWRWFDSVPAITPRLRDAALRLRYQVYCVENQFEDPSHSPDGRESDDLDAHSVHSLLVHRSSGMTAGTVRLVLPLGDAPEDSFALQRVCSDPFLKNRLMFPVERMAEVSRFCVSKEFRRRQGDSFNPSGESPFALTASPEDERRMVPHITLGLIEALVRMSIENGITYWCAVMEPALLRLLTRLGIHFQKIGPMIDYHGRRQPCYIPLDALLERVQRERPDVWAVITREGKHWEELRALCRTN